MTLDRPFAPRPDVFQSTGCNARCIAGLVRPADLDHDIKVFSKALEETARSHNPGTPQQRDHLVAAALLFLAEPQRHGHAEFVRQTLPEVLALAPSREKAFAAAWALVGEGRLGVIVGGWIGKVMRMNDGELTWYYLRASRNPEAIGFDNRPCFFRTLDFLTETGGPETLAKTGLDAHEKRMGTSMGEWERKHLPEIRSAQAELLEAALRHPGKLAEKFTMIAAMDKDERERALRFIEAGLAKWPPAEVKAAVFQAVVGTDSAGARRDLVRFLLDSYEPKGNWGSDEVWYEAVPPLPGDTATRAAMLALLHDESPFQDDSLADGKSTVGRISGGKLTDLGADAWKGLQLDEKLVREITAAVYEGAAAGKYFIVTASIAGTLSGCEIQVEASPGGMTPEAFRDAGLPGLADKPAPRAVCRISIESGFFGFPEGSPRFGFPVWEDEAVTKAWRSEHAHAPPAAGEPDYYYSEIGRKRIPANPEAFEEKLCGCLKLSSYIRDPLRLTIMATGIDKGR